MHHPPTVVGFVDEILPLLKTCALISLLSRQWRDNGSWCIIIKFWFARWAIGHVQDIYLLSSQIFLGASSLNCDLIHCGISAMFRKCSGCALISLLSVQWLVAMGIFNIIEDVSRCIILELWFARCGISAMLRTHAAICSMIGIFFINGDVSRCIILELWFARWGIGDVQDIYVLISLQIFLGASSFNRGQLRRWDTALVCLRHAVDVLWYLCFQDSDGTIVLGAS